LDKGIFKKKESLGYEREIKILVNRWKSVQPMGMVDLAACS
jgi:hypothetical protein